MKHILLKRTSLTTTAEVVSTAEMSFSVANVIAQVGDVIHFDGLIIGGWGDPRNYQINSNSGTINGLDYTAPNTAGEYTLTAKDTFYDPPLVAKATVTVQSALAILPAMVNLAVGDVFRFAASGGVAPGIEQVGAPLRS